MILIFGVFYLLLIRPQQKKQKQLQETISQLKAGDKVVTTGGIVGTIVSISGDLLVIRVKPDNVKLQISRAAVASIVKTEAAVEEKK